MPVVRQFHMVFSSSPSYSDVVRCGTPVSTSNYMQQSGTKKVSCHDKKVDDSMKCHQNPVAPNTGLSSSAASVREHLIQNAVCGHIFQRYTGVMTLHLNRLVKDHRTLVTWSLL